MTLIRDWEDDDGNSVSNAIARLHKYPNQKAKMMFEVDYDFAASLAEEYLKNGSKLRVLIVLEKDGGNADPVDARVDTFHPESGERLNTAPGVCAFSQITWIK